MQYKHLTIEEREKIQLGLWAKRSIRDIAKELDRPPSAISREVKKNTHPVTNKYSPRVSHERALEKRTFRGRKLRLKNNFVRHYVVMNLKANLSPEQISGRLKLDHPNESISHEAIYQFIYNQVYRKGWGEVKPHYQDLRPYLKRRHKRRGQRGMRSVQRVFRPKGPSIDDRPAEVEARKVLGHWEGDSVVSKQSPVGLNTLVERKTGLVLMTKIKNRTALETRETVVNRLKQLPKIVRKTLTVDNGTENSDYQEIADALQIYCYFAHPYHSWERGTNENTNGLIRWYFPKKTDFATISDEEIKLVETALNNRPRKRLGWKTPLEVFNESVALQS